MLAFEVPPVLFPDNITFRDTDDSALSEWSGVVGSVTVMMWLLLAINRSGHLTRDNED